MKKHNLSFDRINLFVSDLNKTIRFYTILGFPLSDVDNTRLNFSVIVNNTIFSFYSKKIVKEYFGEKYKDIQDNTTISLSFSVKSKKAIDDLLKKFEAENFLIFQRPKKESWGQITAFVLDPDGNLIELNSPLQK